MKCPHCGTPAEDGDEFCIECQKPLTGGDLTAQLPPAPSGDGAPAESAAAQEPEQMPQKIKPPAKNKGSVGLFTRPGGSNSGKPKTGAKATGALGAPGGHGTLVKAKPARVVCQGCGKDDIDSDGICANCGDQVILNQRDDFKEVVNAGLAMRSFIGRKHARNEDCGTVAQVSVGAVTYAVMVVSDGVSSAERSNIASETACKVGRETMVSRLTGGDNGAAIDFKAVLRAGIDAAQAAVLAIPSVGELDSYGERKAAPEATYIAAIVGGGTAHLIWLGDCRAYSVPKDSCSASLLTKDHSWINMVVDAGEMNVEQAMNDKMAHCIFQSLGPVDPDGGVFEPDFADIDVSACRLLILSSDGFWNYGHLRQDQAPEQLNDVLSSLALTADAITTAEKLVKFANDAGGHDNITVAVHKL